MSLRRTILVVGGGGKGPPSDGPSLPKEVADKVHAPGGLKTALESMKQEAASKGFDVRIMQLDQLEQDQNAWAGMVSKALESQPWDGFIIGNGIRGSPSLTVLFEELVRIGRVKAPDARMGFNSHPLDLVETMERMFASK